MSGIRIQGRRAALIEPIDLQLAHQKDSAKDKLRHTSVVYNLRFPCWPPQYSLIPRLLIPCFDYSQILSFSPKAPPNRHFARVPGDELPKFPVFFPVSREFGGE